MPPLRSWSKSEVPALLLAATPCSDGTSPGSYGPSTPFCLTPHPIKVTFASSSPGRSPLGQSAHTLNAALERLELQSPAPRPNTPGGMAHAGNDLTDKPLRPNITKSFHSYSTSVPPASPILHRKSPSRQRSPRTGSPVHRHSHRHDLVPPSLRMTSIRTSPTESAASPLPASPVRRLSSRLSSPSPPDTRSKWISELRRRPAPIAIPKFNARSPSLLSGAHVVNSESTKTARRAECGIGDTREGNGHDGGSLAKTPGSSLSDGGPTAVPLTVKRVGLVSWSAEAPALGGEPSPGWAVFHRVS